MSFLLRLVMIYQAELKDWTLGKQGECLLPQAVYYRVVKYQAAKYQVARYQAAKCQVAKYQMVQYQAVSC